MRALVIVHDPGSEAAMVGERLEHHGYEQVEVFVTSDVDHPVGSTAGFGSPRDYELIVPMGSVYSLTDTDPISTWVHDELEFLRDADTEGVPVLGICFGGQLLAAAHGGRVVKSDAPQVGWHPLTPHNGPEVLAGPWMQWHYDRFEPPAEGHVLATDHVGVQAFTLRRNLGLQFHPEVSPDHLARWLDIGAINELDRLGVDADGLLAETAARLDDARVRANALVDWFLADVARR